MNTVVVSETNYNVIVDVQNDLIIEIAQPSVGPAGPPGPAGSTTLVQDSTPLLGTTGDLWFQDTTNVLRVYASGWQNQTMDDGYF